MAKVRMKKVSLSRRIVSLTVFIDIIFLIIIATGFLFYTFVRVNQNTEDVTKNQTQAIVNSTANFLDIIQTDVDLLAENDHVINYLNYINSGENPKPLETDPDYHIYYDFKAISDTLVDHQSNLAYDLIFVATEYNCLTATDGCAIGSNGQVLYDDWFINERPWFIQLGSLEEKFTTPYTDAVTGDYTFTYIKRVYQNSENIGYIGIDISLVNEYQADKVVDVNLFDKDYYATYNNLDEYGWQMVILVDNTKLLSMEMIFGIVLIGIILIVYFISLLINNRIKKTLTPVNTILESIEEIKNGNYKVKVNMTENNEIKEIGDAINIMSKEIEKQVDLVYETFAYDNLTGLKNISAAKIDINKNILSGNQKSAICIFQVENIKNINIIKGQIVGDNLLKTIALELKKIISNSEYIYANGHDEFIYIMSNISSLENVENNINKILAHFKQPLTVKNIRLEVKFYIGISIYPTDGNVLEDLIKKGDTALYKSKKSGTKRYLFYNENIAREISYKAQVSFTIDFTTSTKSYCINWIDDILTLIVNSLLNNSFNLT